ncbi:hypothetical protein H6F61_21120 [Cyanobacteria bacterium FACHB-472]|nr:hypothetical protein [Cyanobacteria bacterium FACHB-472]
MRKGFVVHFLLLDIVLSSASYSALAVIVNTDAYPKNQLSTAISQNKPRRRSTWERIVDIFRRRRDDGSSRGEFCNIWPDKERSDALTIWRDKPLFVWKGTIKRIEVRPAASDEVLWRYDKVTPNDRSVLYTGPTLTPGEKYDYWILYEVTNNRKTIENQDRIPFEILASEKREKIANELARLATNNPGVGAEEMALKRAEYFAQQELWSDVIQEMFSLPSPSTDWKAAQEKLRNQLCPTNGQSGRY